MPDIQVLSNSHRPAIGFIPNIMSENEAQYVLQIYEPYLAPYIGGFPSLLRPLFGCFPDKFGRCLYEIGPVGDSVTDSVLCAI